MNLLGGRAGYNSVMFESETHTSTATRKGNDIIVNKIERRIIKNETNIPV